MSPRSALDAGELRAAVPQVLGVLVRRGAGVADAEDAVQEALVAALHRGASPDDLAAWLVTVAWRKLLDTWRSDSSRATREERVSLQPEPGPSEQADDTLQLLFWCAHPSLTPASAVALTLRALGGLTTRQVAEAFLVPEATMAQRISRAKRTVGEAGVGAVGDLRDVLTVLYLMFNEGYTGEVDIAAEAIRLTRLLVSVADEPEARGLLALMLLHHARRGTRRAADGALVPLAEQDRSRWDTTLVAEGVELLQGALLEDRLGKYQAQAAIAALHCDAASAEETDWPQILSWYDELLALTGSKVVALNRVVALVEADGPQAGLRALAEVAHDVPRRAAVSAWLHERAGDLPVARELYLRAAADARSVAERTHLTRQAARLRATS